MVIYLCEVCKHEFELSPKTFVGQLNFGATCHASVHLNRLCENCYTVGEKKSLFDSDSQYPDNSGY